jgi:hypothetical protein
MPLLDTTNKERGKRTSTPKRREEEGPKKGIEKDEVLLC